MRREIGLAAPLGCYSPSVRVTALRTLRTPGATAVPANGTPALMAKSGYRAPPASSRPLTA